MNKAKVNEYFPAAINALKECKIASNDGEIIRTYRSNISAFGASVTMGSFKAATAFFSEKAKSRNEKTNDNVDRSKLISAIDYVIKYSFEAENRVREPKEICKEILIETDNGKLVALCEKYKNAAVALKLAMNVYDMKAENK